MRLIYWLPIAFSFLFFTAHAQNSSRITEQIILPRSGAELTYSGQLPYTGELPFFSYFVEWEEGPLPMKIRFAEVEGAWGEWRELKRDGHNMEKGITELNIGEPEYRFFELQFDTRSAAVPSAILHFYHPGETSAPGAGDNSAINSGSSFACPCPQPSIEGRSDWCPDGDCPEHPSPSTTDVTHLIVHHSAGTNTATDWAAIVRAIWDLHVNGNGWDDIGYNYLVDPNGVLYEGRGNNILGAHFCGTNTNTMGVCVMGDFTNIEPTEDALDALERLLAWKACDIGADPLDESFHASSGRVLKHISGHRDGCATSCPGDSFYPLLPEVREGTNNEILANCAGLSSPISLSAAEVEPTSYFLSWAHNSPDESGFQLERSIDGGDNFELRATIAANTLNFIESDLELERLYYYRIRAFNETDTSDYSNIVEINTGVVATFEASLPTDAISLSPNPADAILQVQLATEAAGDLQIRVMDLTQRELLAREYRKSAGVWMESISVENLPAGTYLLHVKLNSQQGVWRFVKQ